MRAWIHAEENKRRTLQRSDIASVLAKSDMFDFLIDIVPREEAGPKRPPPQAGVPAGAGGGLGSMPPPPPTGGYGGLEGGHAEGVPDYGRAGGQPMYTPQPGAGGYVQPQGQMYGEMGEIYGYPPMQAQQQMYQVPPQQRHDPSVGQDTSHAYPRHDGGEGDADAEGERDYEVG